MPPKMTVNTTATTSVFEQFFQSYKSELYLLQENRIICLQDGMLHNGRASTFVPCFVSISENLELLTNCAKPTKTQYVLIFHMVAQFLGG